MKILIVDDDCVSRSKLEAILSKYGDCETAAVGEQALKKFEQAHETSSPYDLITMDVEMPGMKGQEVVKRIRDWESEKQIYKTDDETKILMITIKDDHKDIMSAFREGCEHYITKPVNPEKISEAMEKLGFANDAL